MIVTQINRYVFFLNLYFSHLIILTKSVIWRKYVFIYSPLFFIKFIHFGVRVFFVVAVFRRNKYVDIIILEYFLQEEMSFAVSAHYTMLF